MRGMSASRRSSSGLTGMTGWPGALTDGADGLTAYRAIAAKAGDHLNPGGHVLVEIGPTQAGAVGAFFADAGAETQVIHDLDGRDRVILARFSA